MNHLVKEGHGSEKIESVSRPPFTVSYESQVHLVRMVPH